MITVNVYIKVESNDFSLSECAPPTKFQLKKWVFHKTNSEKTVNVGNSFGSP